MVMMLCTRANKTMPMMQWIGALRLLWLFVSVSMSFFIPVVQVHANPIILPNPRPVYAGIPSFIGGICTGGSSTLTEVDTIVSTQGPTYGVIGETSADAYCASYGTGITGFKGYNYTWTSKDPSAINDFFGVTYQWVLYNKDGTIFNQGQSSVGFFMVLVSSPNNLGDCACTGEGDPINSGTGNKFQAETDFIGAANTGLTLTRYYNSADTTKSAFGTNWHSTWHRGLDVALYGGSVTARAPMGGRTFLRRTSRAHMFLPLT